MVLSIIISLISTRTVNFAGLNRLSDPLSGPLNLPHFVANMTREENLDTYLKELRTNREKQQTYTGREQCPEIPSQATVPKNRKL